MRNRHGITPAYNTQAVVAPIADNGETDVMLMTASDVFTNPDDHDQLIPTTPEPTLVMQRIRELIDQEMLERLIAPLTNHRFRSEGEASLLREQPSLVDNADHTEEVVSRALAVNRQGLWEMDSEAG